VDGSDVGTTTPFVTKSRSRAEVTVLTARALDALEAIRSTPDPAEICRFRAAIELRQVAE